MYLIEIKKKTKKKGGTSLLSDKMNDRYRVCQFILKK